MLMAAGLLPNAVISAYESLVNALQQASENANGYVSWTKPLASRFRLAERDNDVVEFDAYLHLDEWKARRSTMSILVHARERIRRSTQALIQSSIHLSYYGVEGRVARHFHSLHYDYGAAQLHHPIFHCQLCHDAVELSPDVAAELAFDYQRAASTASCFREARIPTSDMTLPSVLLCLAADHLKDSFFEDFFEKVRAVEDKMPLPAFDRTKNSIVANPEHLRSTHWFAHMT
jgi:hypothetical protein